MNVALDDAARTAAWPFVPFGIDMEVVRAQGAYLHTRDGRAILDAAGGAIVANVGHGVKEVGDALGAAATNTSYVIPPFATPERIELVERLQRHWLPGDLTRVHLNSGGSEAVEAAMKLARQHFTAKGENRWKIIGLDISYHGATMATLGVAAHAARKRGFEPMFVEMPKIRSFHSLAASLGRHGDNQETAGTPEDLARKIEEEGADTVAAFIVEPVTGASGGALVPPAGYLRGIREVCDRYGILLIADEVMTGFGRTGKNFAVEHEGVAPDILVAGKGLTGGYAPLGGVYASEATVEPLRATGEYLMYYTFGGHPAACAAANAVLGIIERDNLVERVAALEPVMARELKKLEAHPNVIQARGQGLLWAIEVVRDKETLAHFAPEDGVTGKLLAAGLERGVFYYPGGTGERRDIVALGPAFIVTENEIATMARVLGEAVDQAVAGL